MEENLIGKIAQAEQAAAELKAEAQKKAEKILAEAQKKAAAAVKKSEADCAALLELAQKDAQMKVEADYQKSIEEAKREAKEYADSLLAHTDVFVTEILGRLVK